MKLGVLFSGGKDSCAAAAIAQRYGHEVACLLSVQSRNKDSFMFHTPNISLVHTQAEAMGIPIIIQETQGEKEEELKDLRELIERGVRDFQIEGVVTGAVASVYQATRVQKICHELELWCFNPLWQRDPYEHVEELVAEGFEIYIGAIAAYPMDEQWLGKKIGEQELQQLKQLQDEHKVNPSGEGGEFETFVAHGPGWKKRIAIKKTSMEYDNHAGVFHIEEVELVEEEKELRDLEQEERIGNVLLVNTCEEPLSTLEFVIPIANICENNCTIIHYKNNEQIEQELDSHNHVIICGTAIHDDEFIKHLELFDWITKTDKPILGICAGHQIIGLLEGKELVEDLEIGMKKIGDKDVYLLHHNTIKNFGYEHKKDNKQSILFHPEVRNEAIVRAFLNTS